MRSRHFLSGQPLSRPEGQEKGCAENASLCSLKAATDIKRYSAPRNPTPPPKPFIKKAVGFGSGAAVVKCLASRAICQPSGCSNKAAAWQALHPKKGAGSPPRSRKSFKPQGSKKNKSLPCGLHSRFIFFCQPCGLLRPCPLKRFLLFIQREYPASPPALRSWGCAFFVAPLTGRQAAASCSFLKSPPPP